jgi:hypothetical protein
VVTQICGVCKGLQTEVQNLYRLYPIVGNRLTQLNFRLVRSNELLVEKHFMAKTINKPEQRPSQQEIARRAYELYEKSGREPGHEMQHWLEAERQLLAAMQTQKVTPQVIQLPDKVVPRQQQRLARA